MLKKTPVIIFFFVLSLIAFLLYQQVKVPESVIPQSNQAETIAWLSFGTSIVALLTAIVGLIEKIISLKKHDD